MGVEYDGAHWHRNKQKSDARKNQILEQAGINLLRIRVKPLKKLRSHDVLCEKDDLTKDDIHALLNSMLKLRLITEERVRSYEQRSDFLNDGEYRRILSYLPSPVPEKSLSSYVPESLLFWDYEANHPLIPDNFTPRSNRKVNWRCEVHHEHKWEGTINQFQKLRKCPFCANLRPSATYNLAMAFPEIASEWHPSKNEAHPEEVLPGSTKKVWWRCKTDHRHEWNISPYARISNESGCPICSGRVASSENNLTKTHPELLKSWDYSRNKIDPNKFKAGSSKRVHWVCTEHHYHCWEAVVSSRVKGGCPFCSGKRTHEFDTVGHRAPGLLDEFVNFSSAEDASLSLKDLSATSWRRARWQCRQCGHKYTCSVGDRARGEGCTQCNPKYERETLVTKRPDLAAQWHPQKTKSRLRSSQTSTTPPRFGGFALRVTHGKSLFLRVANEKYRAHFVKRCEKKQSFTRKP